MKVTEELVAGEKVVRVKMSCWNPAAFFLLVWWSFWTFGVVTALKKFQGRRNRRSSSGC